MFEMWYRDAAGERICVRIKGLDLARDVWDKIAERHEMLSTRP